MPLGTIDVENKATTATSQESDVAVASPVRTARSSSKGMHMGVAVRIGSRKVQIIQIPKFNILPKEAAAKSIRDEVVKKVGSEWLSGTRDIIRGLTTEEEVIYLPTIIGAKAAHDEWEEYTKLFWADYSIPVPAENGLIFEAGFKYKNSFSDEVVPIDLIGYMQYNFCKASSYVAKEGDDNPATFTFKLIDLAKNAEKDEEIFGLKKRVDSLYLQLVQSQDITERFKIDWIIEAKGGERGYGLNTALMTDTQKEMELERIKNKNLQEFASLIEDKDLETKALIRKAVSSNNIIKEGEDTYILEDRIIGNSLGAAVAWLNDGNNSNKRILLVQRIKEANR